MRPIDRTPPRLGRWIVGGVGIAVVMACGLYSVIALGVGLVGLGIVLVSVRRRHRRWVSIGTVLVFGASLIAAINESPVSITLGCVIGTIVVWDGARVAISLGSQLGRTAPSSRVVVTHVVPSVAVGVVTAIGGYGVFLNTPGGLSPAALVLLVGAVVFLVIGIRHGTAAVTGERG